MLDAKEVAKHIRDKVADLNDELILAKAAEVDVEFMIDDSDEHGMQFLKVWCSQEVR